MTETDFTTYLRNLEDLDPELIVATGHPPGSGPITAQSIDLGMDVPVTGAYSPWAPVMGGAGDTALGRYADFDCADFGTARVPRSGAALPGDVVIRRSWKTTRSPRTGSSRCSPRRSPNVGDDPAAIAE